MTKRINKKFTAILFAASLSVFLYGCGTAPTGVDMQEGVTSTATLPDIPDVPGDGSNGEWW